MIELKRRLKESIFDLLKDSYPIERSMLEIGYTPQPKMGDLALTLPFLLAKKMKRSPKEIAGEIAPLLMSLEGVTKTEVAGAGYVNLFLNREIFFRRRLESADRTALAPEEEKIIIEHTNINPNKAAHIGHLRNAVLGDTLARCLRYKGERVEIQNYIDDTGVQVVDVVFGFMEIEKKSFEEIRKIEGKFDYYCWDLYTRVAPFLEEHPETHARKADILKKIEEGREIESEIAQHISRRILNAHLDTMRRIDIGYEVLPCESSILRLKFWEKAFALLKEKKGISMAGDGPNKGCWIMRLEEDAEKEKVIVRSDGTVTYVGKDIAYQLWKFGLLDKDFFYAPFRQDGEKTVWITTSKPSNGQPEFGMGSLVYNVIDTRQSYLQQVVVQGLRALHYFEQADRSIHFSYEMVALSPKSLKELGLDVSEEDREKSFLEVSGRKGLGVKADDLLDKLEDKALKEVEKRNPEFSSLQKKKIAHHIAVGALRYFMLKFSRNSVIVFDFEEALNFEGETGPYLQYTLVRINSIFRKLSGREGFETEDIAALTGKDFPDLSIMNDAERDDFWDLVLFAAQFDEEVMHSILSLEFSHLSKFTFNLCQKFNAYYHKYSILAEKEDALKNIRILTIHYVQKVLEKSFSLIGIPQPERM